MATRLRVKEIATAKGWTQTKLQRAADVHPRTMQEIYNNPERDVYYSILLKIAKLLKVEVSDLVEDLGENSEAKS